MDLFDSIFAPDAAGNNQGASDHLAATGDVAGRLLTGLNPEQARAVQHDRGPLLILAGAGSGKTRVITHRVAWLVSVLGVRPAQILAITFTNKAAAEMKNRIEELVGPVSRMMWIGTFHAMMMRILRRFADRLGYDSNFTIIDSDDQQRLVRNCLHDLGIDEKTFAPKAVHSQISAAKNALIDVETFTRQAGSEFRQSRVASVYRLYQERLKKSNSMDFDDILVEAVRLLSGHPDVLAEYQERFQYIMVDEYQDTNHAQYRLVHLLAARHQNLCVVGDDDQSIYSFRGANIQNILDFEKDFKKCSVIKLEQNYRSSGHVLKAANAVIGNNTSRKRKTLWTEHEDGSLITFFRAEDQNEEGRYIAGEIDRMVARQGAASYGDFAILYRLNALSRSLEQALREQGIPYRVYGGVRFYDRKEIKDMLAYLRLVLTPTDDLSLTRVINVPRRGIGDATLAVLQDIAAREGLPQLAVCVHADRYPELQRMAPRLMGFAALIGRLRDGLYGEDRTFDQYLDWIETETGLIQELIDQQGRSGTADTVDRIENLKELLSDAVEFENQLQQLRQSQDADQLPPEDTVLLAESLPDILRAFLERAALYTEMDGDSNRDDAVRLLTIHSAKGLEFNTVFLAGAEEGLFPGYRAMGSQADMEEERRLAYVAITRARQKLYITTTRSRLIFGQTQRYIVSTFIKEIPDMHVEEIGGSRQGEYGYTRPSDNSRPAASAYVTPVFTRPSGGSQPASGRAPAMFPGFADVAADKSGDRRSPGASQPAAGQSARTANPKIAYHVGEHVQHARFGKGKIVSVEPVAGDAILVVDFASSGRKRMLARTSGLSQG